MPLRLWRVRMRIRTGRRFATQPWTCWDSSRPNIECPRGSSSARTRCRLVAFWEAWPRFTNFIAEMASSLSQKAFCSGPTSPWPRSTTSPRIRLESSGAGSFTKKAFEPRESLKSPAFKPGPSSPLCGKNDRAVCGRVWRCLGRRVFLASGVMHSFRSLLMWMLVAGALACASPVQAQSRKAVQERADRFLELVNAGYQSLYRVESEAQWLAATELSPVHDAASETAGKARAAF